MRTVRRKIIFSVLLSLILLASVSGRMAAEERIITDMVGRKVSLPAEVERVVTTYTPATQFVMALGADDKLVSGSSGMANQKLFEIINPNINKLESVGSKNKGVNLESVMAADPDLVILFPHNDGLETADRLQKLGIAAVVINPESFEQIRKTNILLGKALNLEEKAALIDEQYKKILNVAQKTREIPEAERKKVYFANSDLLDTVGQNILQTDLIELAGGLNPAKNVKEGFIRASAEELINWNPDLIMVSQFYRGSLAEMKNSAKYQSINAFENDDIYRIPSKLEPWDYPSPSSSLIVAWLGMKLYPEKFSENEFQDTADEFYKTLYGQSYTEFLGELN